MMRIDLYHTSPSKWGLLGEERISDNTSQRQDTKNLKQRMERSLIMWDLLCSWFMGMPFMCLSSIHKWPNSVGLLCLLSLFSNQTFTHCPPPPFLSLSFIQPFHHLLFSPLPSSSSFISTLPCFINPIIKYEVTLNILGDRHKGTSKSKNINSGL